MFEVEAKISITNKQYKQLMEKLKKDAQYLGFRNNNDIYYLNPKRAFIRIRNRDGEYSFDLKLRQTVKGIESNIEIEWGIKNPVKWKNLLKKLNINPFKNKIKKTELFKLDGFLVELNEICLLGHFLEIERIVKNTSKINEAKKDLVNIFKKLGFTKKEFENKSYLELLSNV